MVKKHFPIELSEQIIKQADIVEIISEFVNLNKKGNNYVGLCPFHQDSTPSFTVSPIKQIFKCFPCGAGGNVASFIRRFKNLNFIQAIEYLAQKQNIDYDFSQHQNQEINNYTEEEIQILDSLELVNAYYKTQIWANQAASDYIKQRGLDDPDIRDMFDIGFAPKGRLKDALKALTADNNILVKAGLLNQDHNEMFWDRITFGIKNAKGELVAFSARALTKDTQAKYINSPETELFHKSKILYNYHNAKESIANKKEVVIVEGYMDVIACYKANITNTVAIMGTALTKDHVQLIRNNKVTLFLDNDNAGINASLRSIKTLLENNVETVVVLNKFLKDADEILKEYGAETLQNLVTQSTQSSVDFVYEQLKKIHNLNTNVDFQHLNDFIKELDQYLVLMTEEQIQYIALRLEKDFNYKLKIDSILKLAQAKNKQYTKTSYENEFQNYEPSYIPSYDFETQIDTPTYQTQEPVAYQRAYDKFWFDKKITRINVLIGILSNPQALKLFKQIENIQSLFIYPENVKKLFDELVAMDENQISPDKALEISSEALSDYFSDINNQAIQEEFTNIFINNAIESFNQAFETGKTLPVKAMLNELNQEWAKWLDINYPTNNQAKNIVVPPYRYEIIKKINDFWKNRTIKLKP
ncbi:DNA primase [Mycoplasma sp. Pen4]|uniref:DNA primase n=1 Tax=Mycoplasma sp. Pen4 TaxID=640330 RepID=UPI001653F8B8|nr:DNA primase [Mycoplasma sp. Pen4]QNM93875.1 DNA primase [Mycoplasma sp. Pen4]